MPDQWKGSNQILISYRREDSPCPTGRIYDRLVQKFGQEAIFKDVDSMPLGINFREYLDAIVSNCAAVLVVIGDNWLGHDRKSGKSRLEDPQDFVRLEIESALKRDIPVIPLLVNDAALPETERLPESLRELRYRNGMEVGHDPDFHGAMRRLIANLETIMKDVPQRAGAIQKDKFDTLWDIKKPGHAPSDKPNEPEQVTRKLYPAALLLGMILPSVFALAGGYAGRRVLSSPSAVINEMSGVLLAEMAAVYALAGTGFLIGWKTRRALWRVALLISAFPFAINLGGSIKLLSQGSGSVAASFFILMAFCLTPLMPFFAYTGLHLGTLYSSRKAKGKTPAQSAHEF
jgi:hypothetical protein